MPEATDAGETGARMQRVCPVVQTVHSRPAAAGGAAGAGAVLVLAVDAVHVQNADVAAACRRIRCRNIRHNGACCHTRAALLNRPMSIFSISCLLLFKCTTRILIIMMLLSIIYRRVQQILNKNTLLRFTAIGSTY